jgi:endonuclease/exonuclease/phosphatase (EEP) superfamily protein YafD
MIRKLLSRWTDGPFSAGILLAFGCVIAFAPDPFLLMLARAFIRQWSLVFLGIALFAYLTRRLWSGGAALMIALLLAFPPHRTEQARLSDNGRELVRVTQMNVFQPNDDHADVIAAALATDADVISFQEVSPAWALVLQQELAGRYPFHRLVPGNNCYGIALFSRLPFLRIDVLPLARRSMLSAEVATPEGPVRLLSVHATSPGSYAHFKERNDQLDRLATLVNESAMPVVLFGDLNAVSWDHAFVRLCDRTGLREERGSTQATWPSIAGFALIPLDHILVTKQLAVTGLGVFSISGSDHRGITATIRSRS